MNCEDTIWGVGAPVEDIADIRLLSGTSVSSLEIDFNDSTYHFSVNGEDITNDITRADKKRLVPGFDDTKENRRLSSEHPATGRMSGHGTDPLTESTFGIFAGQIATDPLSAPLAALDKGVSQVFRSSGVQLLTITAILAIVGYVIFNKEMNK